MKHDNERFRLRIAFAQIIGAYALVGVITVGGFVCMVMRVEGGQAVVSHVLTLVAGLYGGRRFLSR